jgi:hypothetical protein
MKNIYDKILDMSEISIGEMVEYLSTRPLHWQLKDEYGTHAAKEILDGDYETAGRILSRTPDELREEVMDEHEEYLAIVYDTWGIKAAGYKGLGEQMAEFREKTS